MTALGEGGEGKRKKAGRKIWVNIQKILRVPEKKILCETMKEQTHISRGDRNDIIILLPTLLLIFPVPQFFLSCPF